MRGGERDGWWDLVFAAIKAGCCGVTLVASLTPADSIF